jgi:hypothetical protein
LVDLLQAVRLQRKGLGTSIRLNGLGATLRYRDYRLTA